MLHIMSPSMEGGESNAKGSFSNSHVGLAHNETLHCRRKDAGNAAILVDDSDNNLSSEHETLCDDDSPSPTMNSHEAQETTIRVYDEDILREQIIRTALENPKPRRWRKMRGHFTKDGRLYARFSRFQPAINQAREAQRSAKKQKPLNGGSHLKIVLYDKRNQQLERETQVVAGKPPIVVQDNSRSRFEPPRTEFPPRRNTSKKRKTSYNETDIREDEAPSSARAKKIGGLEASSDSAATLLRRNPDRLHNDFRQEAPKGPNRNRRSSQLSKPDNPTDATIQSRISDRGALGSKSSVGTPIQPSFSSKARSLQLAIASVTQPPHQQSKINATPTSSRQTAIVPFQPSHPPGTPTEAQPASPPSTVTLCTGIQQCDTQLATSNVYRTFREQLSRAANDCSICKREPCSCTAPQRPAEETICDGDSCFKKWFSNSYLEKHLGIQLNDAYADRQKYGFWLCPECAFKKAILNTRGKNGSGGLPEFGSETLDDGVVRNALNQFSALILQEISMARRSQLPPGMQPLLRIPCIRDEVLGAPSNPLVERLRLVLGVTQGIPLRDTIVRYQLQDLDPSVWIRVVLVSLFAEFVFKLDSPFDDATIWRKGLSHTRSSEQVDMEIQDNRIRTMGDKPRDYVRRREAQRARHIERLNAVMVYLIGGNEGFERLHRRIAEIAVDLNAQFCTYEGFSVIMPKIGDRGNPESHLSDDEEDEPTDVSGRCVQLVTMLGIEFKKLGKPRRICSPAKVRFWPNEIEGISCPASSSGSTSASGSSNQKLIPRKRTIHEMVLYKA